MPLSILNLRTEYLQNPLGLDTPQPRFSWQLASTQRGAAQSAYQLQVSDSSGLLSDTGQVASSNSLHIPYSGPALRSTQACTWQVRVWDEANVVSDWSESASFEMGLLDSADWHAQWITPPPEPSATTPQPAPLLRTEFPAQANLRSARLYITSLGLYLARLNGQPVSDWQFTPGWTSYAHRLQYQTYDVTHLIDAGPNTLAVTLGDGWYRGYLGWGDRRNVYGEQLALLCQLHLTYADGHETWINSDESWRASTGPIRSSDIYMGETYDARLERPNWDQPNYPVDDWASVFLAPAPSPVLVAQSSPPVRLISTIHPQTILTSPSGQTILDFGQNLVGRIRLQVQGLAGTTITLRHAEVLDAKGELYTANLRSATQTDTYILKGQGLETYEPSFTFHGFRYVAVAGWPGDLTLDSLAAIVLHSDLEPTGTFECSHPLINQLQHNIVWGQKGNFVDVPTDCPQRDERLGWTGDAQVFFHTAAFNFNVAAFFTKWLHDLSADQLSNGAVPHVIPNVLSKPDDPAAGATGWADAATIIPWGLYQSFGDSRILEEQYASMAAWVNNMRGRGPNEFLFGTGFHFGDWLALDQQTDGAVFGATDLELIGTAFYAHSVDILRRAALVLGKTRDVRTYALLHKQITKVFQREFLSPNGRLASNTQTAYVLALHFDLLPEKQRPEAVARLVTNIQLRGNHLSTGFLGTPYLCHVLSRFGYLNVAYDLLLQEDYPSWLYPVKHGATTIWERWDGQRPDGSFQTPGMNSFNHYAYGAIGEWLYGVVAGLGLHPAHPGYQRALIQPRPGGRLTYASASLQTPLGQYAVDWKFEGDFFKLDLTIPANGAAEVHLPNTHVDAVTESGQPLTNAQQSGPDTVLDLPSGTYHFQYPLEQGAASD